MKGPEEEALSSETTTVAVAGSESTKRRRIDLQGPILAVGALVLLVIVFTVLNTRFFSAENFFNLLRGTSVLLVAASGATFIIMMGSIDLSVGALVGGSGIVAGVLLRDLGTGAWTILIVLALGLVVGAFNGLLFSYVKLPSFLVTLGSLSIVVGLSNVLIGGVPVQLDRSSHFVQILGGSIGRFPVIALWAILVIVASYIVAFRTRFGRYMFALGGGERVAALAGLPVRRYKLYAFLVAGGLAAFAGCLLASRMSSGSPGMGDSYLLDSIAAVVMGGTALSGGIGGPHRTLLGALIIGVLSNGLNLVGVNPFWQMVVKGFVVILAVAMTMDRTKIQFVK
jgi:ribose/xylose/arabinose/galactoside ABC-type transport system permease subunit